MMDKESVMEQETTRILYKIMKFISGFSNNRMEDMGVDSFIFIVFISLICSLLITYLYLFFYERRATGSQVHRAFPLLGVSITVIFITIQFSLPLSLGLLGALSIVRFRTPIKEPEEIGFIMLVVASSISCATFNLLILAILMSVTTLGLLIMKFGPQLIQQSRYDGLIIITLTSEEYLKKSHELVDLMNKEFHNVKIESIAKDEKESNITYSFTGIKKHKLHTIQAELSDFLENRQFNIFFNRPESI
jgi:hypothetical protein